MSAPSPSHLPWLVRGGAGIKGRGRYQGIIISDIYLMIVLVVILLSLLPHTYTYLRYLQY